MLDFRLLKQIFCTNFTSMPGKMMKTRLSASQKNKRSTKIYRIAAAVATRRRAPGRYEKKKPRYGLFGLLVFLLAVSITILFLLKPEEPLTEQSEESRMDLLLKELTEQNPNSEIFRLGDENY